jgi:signal transduction histidine kinase
MTAPGSAESEFDASDASALLQRQAQVLELVAAAAPVEQTLDAIILALEELIPGARCSVLLLDPTKSTLRHGAAPNLPEKYLRAINGMRIGPRAGSCGTAAFLGERVVAVDVRSDERWTDYRQPAVESGLISCWSSPIAAPRGDIVGTFAVYHADPHQPTVREQRLVDRFTHLASVAIENSRLLTERLAAEANRRARQEAEVARQTAEEHSRAKSALLTSVSHEIRTPLQAIKGFTELLSTLDLDETRREEALARINLAADHLLDLVTDVLDISRIEAGALALHCEPVAVADVVDEVIELLTPLAADRNVNVRCFVDRGLLVRADRRRLRQILLNLVGNAIRHGRRRGRVEIYGSPAGYAMRLEIHDDGPGIPPEYLPRMFTPFAQDEQDPSTNVDGYGLGLMLAHGLTTAMHGKLAAANSATGGAIFTLLLPRPDHEL